MPKLEIEYRTKKQDKENYFKDSTYFKLMKKLNLLWNMKKKKIAELTMNYIHILDL